MAKRMYNKEKRMAKNLEKTKVEKQKPFDLFAEFKKLYDKEYDIDKIAKMLNIDSRDARRMYLECGSQYRY